MSLRILATGKITVAPQKKISKNGNPYATALLSVPSDQSRVSVSIVAFNDSADVLGALDKGDEIAVSGPATLNEWEKDGEVKVSLHLIVEQITTVYKLRQKQRRLQEAQEPTVPASSGTEAFDDSLEHI